MDITYIPAIITASIALLAAILAQSLNNYFTIRRENQKYYREIYEKLISKRMHKFLEYSYLYNSPFDDEYLVKKDLSVIILDMEDSLHYLNGELQMLHSYYKINRYLDDANENIEKELQFQIAFFYIRYSMEIFRKSKIKIDDRYKALLTEAARRYAFLCISTRIENYEIARNNLISLNRFSLHLLSEYSLDYYEKAMTHIDSPTSEMLMNRVNLEISEFITGGYK